MRNFLINFCSTIMTFLIVFIVGFASANAYAASNEEEAVAFQQITVTGTVVDENSEPMAGVNIVVKGTTLGTFTDADGKYTLSVPNTDAVLEFSFIGYATQEIKIGKQSVVNVSMKAESTALEEIVVVGYGVQKKVNVIGSVSTVSSDEITSAPAENVSSALAGRLPGLMSIQSSGRPGANNATLTIRGTSTIKNNAGNTNVLVVIDGIAGRDMNSIEPGDIESISVLKDASAGIYGSRAANGVILITTKKGSESPAKFEYEFYQGFSSLALLPDMTNSTTYATMIQELDVYQGNDREAHFTDEDIEKYKSGKYQWTHCNTDWYDAVLKNFSSNSHHTIRVSGGTKTIKYYGAFGYQGDNGIYKSGSSYTNKYNLRINMDVALNDYINLGLNMGAHETDLMQPYNTSFNSIMRNLPTTPAYWPSGEPGPDIEKAQQPVTDTDADETGYTDSKFYRSDNILTATIKAPWIDGLSLIGTYAYDMWFNVKKYVQDIATLYTFDKAAYLAAGNDGTQDGSAYLSGVKRAEIADPRLTDSYTDSRTITTNVKLNYDKSFGDHTISAFIALESYKYLRKGITAYRRYFTTVDLPYLNFGGTDEMSNGSSVSIDGRVNYFGRLAYNYKEKYLMEFTLRRDGSLRFSKESGRWGIFPCLMLGWRASSEDFWKANLNTINYFKLKASIGQLGNDAVDAFQYLTMYKSGGTSQGITLGDDRKFNSSLYSAGEVNPHITWERATIYNLGFESYLFNSKIQFNADAFYQYRTNILVERNASVPDFTGISLPDENYGIVSSKGIETVLGYNDRKGDWSYGINGNFSFARNKIIEYDEPEVAYKWQRLTGHTTQAFLQYRAIGIFDSQDEIDNYPHPYTARPGDVIIEDYNKDGKISSADQIVYDLKGSPEINFGINFNVSYKNWALTGLISGVGNNWNRVQYIYNGYFGNYYQYQAEDRWTADNITGTKHRAFDRAQDTYWRDGTYPCSYDYYNLAYMRMKSLELSYSFSSRLLNKIKLSNLSLYATGKNLFFIYNKNAFGYDPEISSITTYPTTRILALGARLAF